MYFICGCTCTYVCMCVCMCMYACVRVRVRVRVRVTYRQTDRHTLHYITLHYITLHNIHRYIVEKQLGGYAMAPSCQVHAGADQVHEGSGAMVGARAGHWEVCMAPRITPDAERGIVSGWQKYWRSLERNHWVVTRFSFQRCFTGWNLVGFPKCRCFFERFSYFTNEWSYGITNPNPDAGLVNWNGALSELGRVYVSLGSGRRLTGPSDQSDQSHLFQHKNHHIQNQKKYIYVNILKLWKDIQPPIL